MKRTPPPTQAPVYIGCDVSPKELLCNCRYVAMPCKEFGLLMRRVAKALHDGDTEFLAGHSFIGRLYRPRVGRSPLAPSRRRAVIARDGGRCRLCRSTERLEIDHITPVVWGGTDDMENLQTLCKDCNIKKGPRRNAPRPEVARA